ncbi:MAG: MBL fold metallo-hydrolase [Methylobacteriaceae bacterium]|nr:MBL fold metallo-hydrolase [Methylobacteriaceae bacterium]
MDATSGSGRIHGIALLIDTGTGVAPLAPLVSALSNRRLICLLTHSHYDHIGGAHEFADRCIHAAEAKVLADPTPEAHPGHFESLTLSQILSVGRE